MRFEWDEAKNIENNGMAVIVWIERQDDVIRIISARKANRYERKQLELSWSSKQGVKT